MRCTTLAYCSPLVGVPSTETTRSPVRNPASAAGEFARTCFTKIVSIGSSIFVRSCPGSICNNCERFRFTSSAPLHPTLDIPPSPYISRICRLAVFTHAAGLGRIDDEMPQRESVAILTASEQESSRTTRRRILLLPGSRRYLDGSTWVGSWTGSWCWRRRGRVSYLYAIDRLATSSSITITVSDVCCYSADAIYASPTSPYAQIVF